MFNEKFQKKTARLLKRRDERRAALEQHLLNNGMAIMEDGFKQLMARAGKETSKEQIMGVLKGLLKGTLG